MENLPIGGVDIVVIGLVVMSGLLAYFRGFIRELLSIVAWVGAVGAGFYGYGLVAPYLADYILEEAIANVVAGVGIGVVTLVALSVGASMVSGMVQDSHAGSVDKALGFLFGLARGCLILSLIYLVTTQWFIKEEDLPGAVLESRSLPVAKIGAEMVMKALPEEIRRKANLAEREARQTEEEIREKLELYDKLSNPKPLGAGENSGTQQPAYGDKERQQLDSLIKEAE